MGKAIVIPNLSFALNNLGQVTFIMDEYTLKITATQALTISFSNNLKYNTKQYPDWHSYTANTVLYISEGTTVYFKGNLTPTENGIGKFTILSGTCTVSGNPIGLLENNTMTAHAFKGLFSGCTTITSAANLVLPATLTEGCFEEMFMGCTGITVVPALTATSLATDCYTKMFYGCSSLNHIVCYNLDDISEYVNSNWISGVTNSGTFEIDYLGNWDATNKASHIPSGWNIDDDHNKPYEHQYMTIDIVEGGKFTILPARQNSGVAEWTSSNAMSIDYKLNGNSWTTYQLIDAGLTLDVVAGDKIKFRGTNTHYCNNSGSSNIHKQWYVIFGAQKPKTNDSTDNVTWYNTFTESTASFNVYGNITSLCFGDNFVGQTALPASFTFCTMFKASKVISAEHLILPEITLQPSCYRAMFSYAKYLTTSPTLPNIATANECYKYIFESCLALTKITCLAPSGMNTNAFECWTAKMLNNSNVTLIKNPNTSVSTSAASSTAYHSETSSTGVTSGNASIGSNWVVQDYVAA